jgi:hypothetical protein
MTTIDTVTVDAFPRYRARIVADVDPQPPYDDGSVPIIRVAYDTRHGWTAEQVADVTSYTVHDAIVAAARRWGGDVDTFTRYVRAFHGVTRVEQYDPREGGTYLALDPADWRDEVGASVEAIAAQDDLMGEFRAYLEGDTYGIVVDKLSTWHNPETGEDRDEWDFVDQCWGFYGDAGGYVADRAREMIGESAGA